MNLIVCNLDLQSAGIWHQPKESAESITSILIIHYSRLHKEEANSASRKWKHQTDHISISPGMMKIGVWQLCTCIKAIKGNEPSQMNLLEKCWIGGSLCVSLCSKIVKTGNLSSGALCSNPKPQIWQLIWCTVLKAQREHTNSCREWRSQLMPFLS